MPPPPPTLPAAAALPEWGSALRLFSQLIKFIKSLVALHGRDSMLERSRLTASYFARIRAAGQPAYDVLRLLVPRVSEATQAVGQYARFLQEWRATAGHVDAAFCAHARRWTERGATIC